MSKERKNVIGFEMDAAGVFTVTVLGAGSFQFDPSLCSDECERGATINGYKQGLADAAAISRDPETGASATPKQKLDRMYAKAKRWMEGGPWASKAAAKQALNRACLFAAIASVRQVAPEKVAAKFQGYEDKVLQTFLTHRDIVAEYSRLTAPQGGQAEVDAMLEGLEVE